MKLMLILLLLITSLMAVVGAFLTISVSSFYINSFYEQMNTVFGENGRDFVSDLRAAAAEENGADRIVEILDAKTGPLGIDHRTRNYFLLDGATGAYLSGSAEESEFPREQSVNLLAARNAVARQDSTAVGDESDITADFMDVAIPIFSSDHAYIIYILDNKATVTGLNGQLFLIIMQALVIGLLISVLLSFLLSKTMVGPIEKLTAGAERVAAGDFDSELPVESTDEIGILTGTFNEMSGVLQATLAAVENERNKLDTLFFHMTDGVVAFDHKGRLIHCNPAADTMLQRPVDSRCTYEELFGEVYPFRELMSLQRPNFAGIGTWNCIWHPSPTRPAAASSSSSTTSRSSTGTRTGGRNSWPMSPTNCAPPLPTSAATLKPCWTPGTTFPGKPPAASWTSSSLRRTG